MNKRNSFLLSGSLVVACFASLKVAAANEPIMRVLVHEGRRVRLRADGDSPLYVKGIGSSIKKVSTLTVFIKEGNIILSVNGRSTSRNSYLSPYKTLRISSYDPRGIWLGKRRYEGDLIIRLKEDKLNTINHLGVESYLQSVVGSEMPKSWPIEALKAQAVAARTYALARIDKQAIYDIKSSQLSQVYLGLESQAKKTNDAVFKTRSLVLFHQNQLINAVFHSSSGGKTEDSENVWKYKLPYLRSVTDHYDKGPHYNWQKKFTPKDLLRIFKETGGVNEIKVVNVSDSGRILEAKVSGPEGQIVLTGNTLRKKLDLRSTLASMKLSLVPMNNSTDNRLRSQSGKSLKIERPKTKEKSLLNRSIAKSLDVSPPPSFYKFKSLPPPIEKAGYQLLVKGSGSGHGVGMSQWGARGMAQKGVSYRRILKHYYKGVRIGPYYSN